MTNGFGNINLFPYDFLEELDLIDIVSIKNETFIRLRNYHTYNLSVSSQIDLNQSEKSIILEDMDLAIHCLEINTNNIKEN